MARIVYGPLVTQIKGSIGGLTFQNNTSGAILRLRPNPPKTTTVKQNEKNVWFAQAQANWSSLSLFNKGLWQAFAALNTFTDIFGTTKKLTGANWFTKINYWYLIYNAAYLDVPPAYALPNPVTSFTVAPTNLTFFLTAFTIAFQADTELLIYATLPQNSSAKFDFNKTRFIRKFRANATPPVDLKIAYEQAWGIDWDSQISPGQQQIYVMIQVVNKLTGITSVGIFNTFAIV